MATYLEKLDRKLIIEKSKVENFKAIFPRYVIIFNNKKYSKYKESEMIFKILMVNLSTIRKDLKIKI